MSNGGAVERWKQICVTVGGALKVFEFELEKLGRRAKFVCVCDDELDVGERGMKCDEFRL